MNAPNRWIAPLLVVLLATFAGWELGRRGAVEDHAVGADVELVEHPGGALLGRGGASFVEAIRSQLCPALDRLKNKFHELDGDVKVAIQAMKDEDSKSAKGFK